MIKSTINKIKVLFSPQQLMDFELSQLFLINGFNVFSQIIINCVIN
jgi:hypothetical protein